MKKIYFYIYLHTKFLRHEKEIMLYPETKRFAVYSTAKCKQALLNVAPPGYELTGDNVRVAVIVKDGSFNH